MQCSLVIGLPTQCGSTVAVSLPMIGFVWCIHTSFSFQYTHNIFIGSKQNNSVLGWGTWGCPVSKFPWSYGDNESCYLLAGKVTVTPDDGRKAATFEKGDFATFPAGMSCTWDVTEAVEKHYMFF